MEWELKVFTNLILEMLTWLHGVPTLSACSVCINVAHLPMLMIPQPFRVCLKHRYSGMGAEGLYKLDPWDIDTWLDGVPDHSACSACINVALLPILMTPQPFRVCWKHKYSGIGTEGLYKLGPWDVDTWLDGVPALSACCACINVAPLPMLMILQPLRVLETQV